MSVELNPENEIMSITFDHEGAHMALCHKMQGYGANGRPEALLIKSDEVELTEEVLNDIEFIKATSEVRIETNMMTFLRKWMGMYWDDAEALARIMGYEGDGEEASEWIEERIEGITLLKSKFEGKVTDEDVKELEEFMKSCNLEEDSSSEGDSDMKDGLEKGQQPSDDKLNDNQGDLMAKTDQETLDKAQEAIDAKFADMEAKLAEFEKAAAKAEADKEALAAKVEDFEKAEQARIEKAFNAKVETYSFITPEAREDFAKTLISVDSEAVVDALDKAQAAINALDKPQGNDNAEGVNLEKSSSLKDKLLAEFGDSK